MYLSNDQIRILMWLEHEHEISGRELRCRLNEGRRWWWRWTAAGFYQMISDMIKGGFINPPNIVDLEIKGISGFKEYLYSSTILGKNKVTCDQII